MKWRNPLLVAGMLAAVGVIVGSVVAFGVGSSSAPQPAGAETILSIDPAEQTVACGREPITIRVFLDDLPARPSLLQPDVSYGITGFQFLLRYDTDIVRIADPAVDVKLNAALDEEDPDGDGLTRTFFLVSDIDDFAGEALLAGLSLPPGGDGVNNFEEGPDPVANGEPLLLLTVRFLTVGQGTTVLTLRDPAGTRHPGLEEPQVADPAGNHYELVTVRNATLTVEGGDCPQVPPATPRPTPTPRPTVPPVPTLGPAPTPAPVTPVPAADAGRADCPQDWAAYNDPDGYFSLCYPADWTAKSSPPQAYFGHTLSLQSPDSSADGANSVHMVVYWSDSSPFDLGLISERCALERSSWQEVREVALTLAGRTIAACVYDIHDIESVNPGPALYQGTSMEIPLGLGDGYVNLRLSERKDISQAGAHALSSIVQSLRVGQ